MMRSTQQQVAALVAVSVLVAYFVTLGVVLILHNVEGGFGGPPRSPDMRALNIVAGLYAAHPDMRAELQREAAAAHLDLRQISAAEIRACGVAVPGSAACPLGLEPGTQPVQAGDVWLGVTRGAALPHGGHGPHGPPHRPSTGTRIAFLLAVVGLPSFAISLWASRRVTAPLRRLTEQAEKVDPETVAVTLPVGGTTEIRLLAEAFNRLILRLTRYAADQRRMLAAVSHDLRTPLTRLRLRAESIADPGLRAAMVRDTGAMQVLIDHTLQLLQAQDKAAELTVVDLPALLQTVADDMADAGVAVRLGGLAPLQARCNASMLRRAVENLVDNAAKHGGGGTISLHPSGDTAVIEVADEGPGLPEADRDMAFEPWFRGDAARTGPGNGLGLAIVKTLMAAQGGQVELSNNAAGGLTARLIVQRAG
jgi:signal transduction histidine kinase